MVATRDRNGLGLEKTARNGDDMVSAGYQHRCVMSVFLAPLGGVKGKAKSRSKSKSERKSTKGKNRGRVVNIGTTIGADVTTGYNPEII